MLGAKKNSISHIGKRKIVLEGSQSNIPDIEKKSRKLSNHLRVSSLNNLQGVEVYLHSVYSLASFERFILNWNPRMAAGWLKEEGEKI